ncbi:hypothetical protein SERLA73DRAFT_180409 [Serpula lacrymans var. lacrymans S7.3]|uniref:FK506-binding protein n=1 Tax=Serpula lacrymans var. lacrymans (strain S7.3) TaxID=936435 RepID=F8PUJ6_SERL3|nr:hypothetical protein SERLA73DRAFT_180409 [Serpula lacrymans var. lacrymans S7.3]
MAVAIAVWSVILESGKKQLVVPQSDLRITNAALGAELADGTGRTSIKLVYNTPIALDDDDDEEDAPPQSTTILCSLTAGKIEQSAVDIILERDEEYVFEVVGKNTIYLTGNYIDQMPPDEAPFGDESDSDDEGAFNLEDVSSDVEAEADDLDLEDDADRFEELSEDDVPKSLKRPREPEAMDTDAKPEEEKLSKAQKKKLNKKLKADDGKAVAAGAPDEDEKVEKKQKDKSKKEEKSEKKEKEGQKAAGTTQTLAGGLKFRDVKVGTGKAAKNNDRVGMRYIGKLTNGTIFDKNVKGKPFSFRLGKGEVIKGWDIGIAGMQVGGERELTIPAKLAYGSQKIDKIPANSTLVFEVKLLELK